MKNNKIKEADSSLTSQLDIPSLLENTRKGKTKDIWEELKKAGLTTVESVSNFFLSVSQEIKTFLVGEKGKSGIIPEPIKKILTTLYEFVIRAIRTSLNFISKIFKGGKETLSKTITIPGGYEVKLYTIVALGAIGSVVVLGLYKLVQAVERKEVEETPAEMEKSIQVAAEAFEKTQYLFDGITNLKEDEEDDDGFIQNQVETLVEKASYVANDVINFADPDIEPEKEDSKLIKFFKEYKVFVILSAVSAALVVIARKALLTPPTILV